jgi:thioredoxin 2
VVDANDDEFHAVADESSLPVLVDVWAPWCGPCRMVSPALEKLAGELAGKLKLVKVNADDNPQVSQRFEVQSIPTLVLLDHGQVMDKQIGALPEHRLRSWLESKLPTRPS